jgi:hypothetical protein
MAAAAEADFWVVLPTIVEPSAKRDPRQSGMGRAECAGPAPTARLRARKPADPEPTEPISTRSTSTAAFGRDPVPSLPGARRRRLQRVSYGSCFLNMPSGALREEVGHFCIRVLVFQQAHRSQSIAIVGAIPKRDLVSLQHLEKTTIGG